MGDSHNRNTGSVPGGTSPSAPGPAASDKPAAPPDEFAGKSGRIVHDERGNAIWDWIKETSRIAIESTSHLLKKLEVPELKMEDTQENNELKLEADRDAGGGYNPYGGSIPGGKAAPRGGPGVSGGRSGGKVPGSASSASTSGRGSNNSASSKSGGSNLGGGYDPYGKDVTRKPGR